MNKNIGTDDQQKRLIAGISTALLHFIGILPDEAGYILIPMSLYILATAIFRISPLYLLINKRTNEK